jgi:hypothetical protein
MALKVQRNILEEPASALTISKKRFENSNHLILTSWQKQNTSVTIIWTIDTITACHMTVLRNRGSRSHTLIARRISQDHLRYFPPVSRQCRRLLFWYSCIPHIGPWTLNSISKTPGITECRTTSRVRYLKEGGELYELHRADRGTPEHYDAQSQP